MEPKEFTPADLLKELNEMKESLEAKGNDNLEKALEEKLGVIKTAIEELKDAKAQDKTAEELKAIKADLATTIKAFDLLQTRVNSKKIDEPQKKSYSDLIAEAVEENHDNFQKFVRGEKNARVEIELKAVADFSTANVTGSTVWGAGYRSGIIVNPNQIGHIRNFLPVIAHGPATNFYFMRENGAGEGAPAPTSEKQVAAATTQATGLKPQFDVDLVEADVKFETIAGFMVASNKSLNNIPGIMNFLNLRIPEKLLDVEDAQLLYGNGTTPNIKGILTAGNFTAGSAAGTTPLAEKIINDLAVLEDTHKRTANMILMRPVDYWSFFKNKATGSGEYDLPQNVVFVNGQLYIGGVPVMKTTALTTNDYVIGSAGGAEIQQQESMRIEFFREDGTNVRTNQVTIRIEETIALPVYGANYFIKGSSALA